MARAQTMVQLTDELVAALDRRAARENVSRSQVVREAVEQYLAQDREAEIDRRIVAGYTRMPQGGEFDRDEWGDLARFTAALAEAMLGAVAAEEQDQADASPW